MASSGAGPSALAAAQGRANFVAMNIGARTYEKDSTKECEEQTQNLARTTCIPGGEQHGSVADWGVEDSGQLSVAVGLAHIELNVCDDVGVQLEDIRGATKFVMGTDNGIPWLEIMSANGRIGTIAHAMCNWRFRVVEELGTEVMFAKHCVRMSLLLPGYERDCVIFLVPGITPLLFVRSSPEGWETTVWDENGLTVFEVLSGMTEEDDEATTHLPSESESDIVFESSGDDCPEAEPSSIHTRSPRAMASSGAGPSALAAAQGRANFVAMDIGARTYEKGYTFGYPFGT